MRTITRTTIAALVLAIGVLISPINSATAAECATTSYTDSNSSPVSSSSATIVVAGNPSTNIVSWAVQAKPGYSLSSVEVKINGSRNVFSTSATGSAPAGAYISRIDAVACPVPATTLPATTVPVATPPQTPAPATPIPAPSVPSDSASLTNANTPDLRADPPAEQSNVVLPASATPTPVAGSNAGVVPASSAPASASASSGRYLALTGHDTGMLVGLGLLAMLLGGVVLALSRGSR